jgi:hypothetical protein
VAAVRYGIGSPVCIAMIVPPSHQPHWLMTQQWNQALAAGLNPAYRRAWWQPIPDILAGLVDRPSFPRPHPV